MEKLDSTTTSGPFKVGVLTMEGECKTEDDNINVKLSHTEEKFVSGELLCLMGKLEVRFKTVLASDLGIKKGHKFGPKLEYFTKVLKFKLVY